MMKSLLKKEFNIWSNHVKHKEFQSLFGIYSQIKNEKYKNEIEAIRKYIEEGNKNTADMLKGKLDAFTVSGIFSPAKNRKRENIQEYTGVFVLDIDDLSKDEIEKLIPIIKAILYTLMVFISPSGRGIKIIVATNNRDVNRHKECYQQVINYYSKKLNVNFDEQTNDVTRLCYFSSDSNAYFNMDAEIFICDKNNEVDHVEQDKTIDYQIQKQLEYAVRYTERKIAFKEGSRHDFIHLLASNCNRYGYNKEKVLDYCLKNYVQYNFINEEIVGTINSAYERVHEFGQWSKKTFTNSINEPITKITTEFYQTIEKNENNDLANTINNTQAEKDDEIQLDSPYISEEVKKNLPEFIKEILKRLESKREQDIFITGLITVLSGIIEAHGTYNKRKYYSPLYSFISAPPASGKGALNHYYKLVLPLHKQLKNQSDEAFSRYQLELQEYTFRKANKEKDLEKPEKPLYKTLLIPANSSSSQIIEHLQDNGEKGVIIETEADTLSDILNTDFGNFSDVLRKSFEHEHISLRRKTNKQYLELYEPRLSIALSGTPDQLKKLITSVENGLFSRFIYYVFRTTPKWRDVSPVRSNEKPLHILLEETGNKLVEQLIVQQNNPIEFYFTDSQWKKFNDVFEQRIQEMSCFIGEDISANIFRLGCSTFRIAMVLSVLQLIEDGEQTEDLLVCTNEIFEMAMSLSQTYYEHLEFAFKLLKDSNEVINSTLKNFLTTLPDNFDRKTAIETVKKSSINVHERTVDKYLKRLTEYQYLKKIAHNHYEKLINI